MAVLCDGCSAVLVPAEEDGALVVVDLPGHRWRLCRKGGCATAILRVVEPAILQLRTQHGRRNISHRAMNLKLPSIRT